MAEKLRIGVVGCGAIAQIMHIPYLVDYDQFELVALADANKGVLDAVGNRYNVARRYVDWHEMFAAKDIEAVALLHSGSHHDTIIAALDANKHIFVEKPIAWNVREAEEVAARAAKSDRIVQIGYHKLYDPAFIFAREQVRNMHDLGLLRITVLHPSNDLGLHHHRIRRGNGIIEEGHVDVPEWDKFIKLVYESCAGGPVAGLVDEALGLRKLDKRLRMGYGLLVQSIIHQIYSMHGLLGDPVRAVSLDIWRDGMSLHGVIEYPNDVRCTLDYHYLPTLKKYHEEYAFFGNHERIMLQFPSPYLKNFPSPVIIQGGDGETSWEKNVTVSYTEAFRNELLAFYENVRENKQPISSIQDGVKHTRFIQSLIDVAR